MQSLRDVQRGFAAALFDIDGARVPLVRANGLSPALRLGFYRTNVVGNYLKALSLTYPMLERVLGAAPFAALAKQYIRHYPYTQGDLTNFGDQFADFVAHHPSVHDKPVVADLARLEWAMEEVFAEADHSGLSAEKLAGLPLDHCHQLRFLLHPATRLMSSNFPLTRIWQLASADAHPRIPEDLQGEGEHILVWRDRYEVTLECLDAGDFTMLLSLSTGESFGTAFGYAAQACTGFDPAEFLRKYVGKRVLADFTLPAEAYQ